MKFLLAIILLLGLSPCSSHVYAQENAWLHQTFGTRDGMLSPKIYTLIQTNNRLLWIGTELGVSFYNGYEFHNYQYTVHNEIIGRILALAEDSAHGIWIGGDNGLFYFRQNNFVKVNLPIGRSLAVEALLTDNAGNLWVADIFAIYKIDSAQLNTYTANHHGSKILSPFGAFTKRAFALTIDRDHNVYTGGYDAVYRFPNGNMKFETFCLNKNPKEPIRTICAASPDSLYWSRFQDMPEQYLGGKLISTSGKPQIGRYIFLHEGKPIVLTTSNVSSFDENNQLQILFSYDSVTRNGSAAIADAEGNFWIGTWEGLHKFRKTAFVKHHLADTENKEVFSMLETKNGELLFGGNRGKVFVKTKNGISRHPTIPILFPLAEVLCMTETADGAIWAGSGYEGITRLHKASITRYMQTGNLKDNNCEMLLSQDNGNLLACTENGVSIINPLLPQTFSNHYPYKEPYARYPELFGGISLTGDHTWFFGSKGLYRLENGVIVNDSIAGLATVKLYINKIISDKKDNIWIATLGKGLLQCKREGSRLVLKAVFDKSSLPTDNALSVLEDAEGNIWCADYMSLSRLQPKNESFEIVSFFEKDGLLHSNFPNLKLEMQRNGTMWMLTSMGMLSFHPDQINLNKVPPVLQWDSLVANNPGQNMNRTFSHSVKQVLPYNENSLLISVTAVSLTDPSKVRYAYRLLGSDSNWIYSSSRTMAFRFLKPGNYTIEVKASNNNGIWTLLPLEYSFEIKAPFWQTPWFIGLTLLFFLLLASLLVRKRIANIKSRAAIKQQLAELEAKAIRAQMNPHFIFNSLNAIQECIVMNDYETSYQYLSKFSKLLRMVLVHSEKNLILLREEIEMNRLYIELESLRFRQSFHYHIYVEEDLDINTILFPSIIVQPFIENAVWHGLLPKDGEKNITVSYTESNGVLVCTIDDDGIGREKAALIKKQKLGTRFFESKATEMVKQRMKIFEHEGTVKAKLEIVDKKDDAGNAIGTKVMISVPIIFTNKEMV